ncbi:unnamed protein product [Rotaria sp. Silwood1]|nr:unnamed protein product [Rotaria sp. Silwood1]
MSEWPSKWKFQKNNQDQNFTFVELYRLNITSEQLYLWSAPMDVVEHYQFYLNLLLTSNTSSSSMATYMFYNCTSPRFGPLCQYSLDAYKYHHLTVNEIIREYYLYEYEPTTLTCYTHLQCDRGSLFACLDWSEICDGVIDCRNGVDEESCWQVEINECEDNEVRCLNGQCISKTFFHDDPNGFECLDRSDRKFFHKRLFMNISGEPTFTMEDIKCSIRHSRIFMKLTSSCVFQRSSLLQQFLFSEKSNTVSNDCWLAVQCQLGIQDSLSDLRCLTDNSSLLLSSNLQHPSTFNLFDDTPLNYFSSLTSTMNLSDRTTVKISNTNNNNNNNNLTDAELAALFVSSMIATTPLTQTPTTANNSIDNINNNNNELSTNSLDDVFLNQVTDLTYCSSPSSKIIDKQQTIGPPPGFENFLFNSSSTSDLLVSKTTNNNPTISSISNAPVDTTVSSSDTINFSQLLKSTSVDTQQQQQSNVGNAGNIRSSSSSSHSPFTSDEQSLFFPMSTHSYSSASSSSSILHATSQIFSTNTPPSTTTTTTTNSAAKPHIPNSLSLYNNNHLSPSSLVTFSTTDNPILTTTVENEKKITDKTITPSHIFASTNSFFSNESTGK